MNPYLEVLLAIAAIGSTLIQGLELFIIRDLRDRVVRVEDWIIQNASKIDERQRVIPFGAGQVPR